LRFRDGRLFDVESQVDAHLSSEIEAVVIDVGDHDVSRSGMSRDRGRHNPDRPCTGNQYVFSKDVEGERRVYGIAERIEDGGGIAVHAGFMTPDIRHRKSDELRERSWPVHSHS
jgi:hypothetical protein